MRMSYNSFAVLRKLVESQICKLENEFHIACNYIPSEPYDPKKMSGIEKAHQIFMKEVAQYHDVLKDLHTMASESYKDHPNKEMREFWGLRK